MGFLKEAWRRRTGHARHRARRRPPHPPRDALEGGLTPPPQGAQPTPSHCASMAFVTDGNRPLTALATSSNRLSTRLGPPLRSLPFYCIPAPPLLQVPGGWSPEGTQLVPGAQPHSLTCVTSHLSTFSVRPLPRVQAVSGCGKSEGPFALYCRPRALTLTISGRHFGPDGAQVLLHLPTGAAEQPCLPEHARWREDSRLLCRVPALPPAFPGQWVGVTVTTRYGTAHTLAHAVLFAAAPVLHAVWPLGGGCAQAGARALTGCRGDGAAFAISGERLLGHGPTVVAVGPHKCADVEVLNDTFVECRALRGAGAGHAIRLTVGVGPDRVDSGGPGPAFTLSFRPPCANKPGHWAGPGCRVCQAAYYGPDCQFPCPGAPVACGGHGVCDGGVGGSGRCRCFDTPERGHWDGEGCGRCRAGYAGANCTAACPVADPQGALPPLVCGGRGACDTGPNASAVCVCTPPFAGPACGVRCPAGGAGLLCAGHGACTEGPVAGQGVCGCWGDAARGHWAGEECEQCAVGWVGPSCTAACPRTSAGPCAGHGQCVFAGDDGARCLCGGDFVGVGCAEPCPRDAAGRACSGHGTCVLNSTGGAACACAATAASGHWGGVLCAACAPEFAGAGCNIECPTDAQGRVCSARGTCTATGECACVHGACGVACEVPAAECTAATCPAGRYGLQCQWQCQCGPHGACLDGPYGTGRCLCDDGWVGVRCAVQCEGGAVPCSGHGLCSPINGTCQCLPNWRTPPRALACSARCPGPTALPCSGHGACDAAGACACAPGYGGPDCGVQCPSDPAGRPCGGHGTCGATGRCVCSAGAAEGGWWGGAVCGACAAGYFGATCGRRCVSGQTVGRACLCIFGWAGEDCATQCRGGAALPCAGHGACNVTTGACACVHGFAGPACDRRCPTGGEDGAPCSGHGACDGATGLCRCDDSARGHWTGAACDACAGAYFGPACAFQCPVDAATGLICGGHGTCGPAGTCVYHTGPATGHWEGPLCAACAPHYYGPACRDRCPGDSCSPCGGHGTCRDGLHGNGTCACLSGPEQGYWDPDAACADCLPGYYAPGCVLECPAGAARPCGGHGVCSGGVHGSGGCACTRSPAHGFWAGRACDGCAVGYYAVDCRAACPGGGGAACHGHGACDDGQWGTGRCSCDSGFAGADCGLECPREAGHVCGGHGRCAVAGAGTEAAVCECDADPILGFWQGDACTGCQSWYAGPRCAAECPGGASSPCSGRGTCGYSNTAAAALCACDAGYAGANCSGVCPRHVHGRLCNGHGRCDPAAGVCACDAGPATGHWAGPGCTRCADGWSGAACGTACPRGPPPAARPCSGRGACVAGRCVCEAGACGAACAADGAVCVQCAAGTWGPACNNTCPGGAAAPCGGHGVCLDGSLGSGVCICDAGFTGEDCSLQCPGPPLRPCGGHGACDLRAVRCLCDPGWAGPDCAVECPRDPRFGAVCGARGTCLDGAAGNGTCRCVPGFVGLACEHVCPGTGPRGPCTGHGHCSAALAGACECAGHWGGAACAECRGGWHGADCGAQCFEGDTVGTVCRCAAGWAGPDCDVACPGRPGDLCSGRGVCNATHLGDGSCACDRGWRGPACSVPCAGLLSGGQPCGGHGACLGDGACSCNAGAAGGYWAREVCDRCQEGFAGPLCDVACPRAGGRVCGGHGQCSRGGGACDCYEGGLRGYWDPATNCTDCLPGYWGPECRYACPGGACAPCSGHGACDGRVNGSGACACAVQWVGGDCGDCMAFFYGPDCSSPCPTSRELQQSAGPLPVCSGHGTCSEGRFGSGGCECEQSAHGGYWAGANCSECLAGHWGPACARPCPGGPGGVVCSGHGRCADGVRGDGTCACQPPYGGAACGRTCPAHRGAVCNGVGACDAAALACDCGVAARGQHWAGAACEACAPGWVGARCDTPCPRDAASGAVCAGVGVCRLDAAGDGAVCDCPHGYYGSGCQSECPGGHLSPCSGHGSCDPVDGTCTCADDAQRGHFGGPACGRCASGWSGGSCLQPCPLGQGGVPCSGYPCQFATCYCGPTACGPNCNVTGNACLTLACPEGRYGPMCAFECPRPASSAAACTGHGSCLAMVYADGKCHCDPGYAGEDCAAECPGGPGNVCTGHGACSPARATCECLAGFAGAACDIPCPRRGGRACAGHGLCNDTAAGNGACTCQAGYAAADCGALCPGFDPADPVRGFCGGHGWCLQMEVSCLCLRAPEAGYWSGPECGVCESGWFGEHCRERCGHGRTQGKVCWCDDGWAAADCSTPCPALGGERCGGHGLCRDGHTGDGTCQCDPMWYGAACGVFCDARDCFPNDVYPEPHPQCNPVTGQCECQRNASGHWGGPECNVCQEGYWGLDCSKACDCNYHGVCGWLDGDCACYQDSDRGFWMGEHCEVCLHGYVALRLRLLSSGGGLWGGCIAGGGGVGTRPWWLALLACGGAYWPLAFEPSAVTSRPPYYCGHPHYRGHPPSWLGIQNATSAHGVVP